MGYLMPTSVLKKNSSNTMLRIPGVDMEVHNFSIGI